MKYYDEGQMSEIRKTIEDEVLFWQNISIKKMFGCPCYKKNEKMFMFLITNGVVLIRSTDDDKKILLENYDAIPFQGGGRIMKNWLQIPLNQTKYIDSIMPYIRKSYELVG